MMDHKQRWLSWPILDDATVYDDTELLALIIKE